MIYAATLTLLLILCCLQNRHLSVSAFLTQPQTQSCAYQPPKTFLLGRQEEEEEWLRKRKQMEEEQKEWERKMREKDEQKQKGGRVGLGETRSATNARLNKNNESQTNRNGKSKDLSRLKKVKVKQN